LNINENRTERNHDLKRRKRRMFGRGLLYCRAQINVKHNPHPYRRRRAVRLRRVRCAVVRCRFRRCPSAAFASRSGQVSFRLASCLTSPTESVRSAGALCGSSCPGWVARSMPHGPGPGWDSAESCSARLCGPVVLVSTGRPASGLSLCCVIALWLHLPSRTVCETVVLCPTGPAAEPQLYPVVSLCCRPGARN
jgi:hypothetical protein